jgi:peptidoglycan/LPS O-acetylase OafA/YrhL
MNHQARPNTTANAPVTKVTRHFVALDGLRGLAALLVVFFHIGWPTHLTNNIFVANGYLAVDLFFVLSGFVIFQNYAEDVRNIQQLRRFFELRFFRVYPLHFVILSVLVGLEFGKLLAQTFGNISEQPPFTLSNSYYALISNVLLLQGMHTLNDLSWNIPSWSISCEFFAYVVFGVLALTGAVRLRSFPLFAIVGGGLIYASLAIEYGNLDVTFDWGILRCIAGFFFGSAIALIGSIFCRVLRNPALAFLELAVAVAAVALMSLVTGSAVVLVIPLFVVAVALLQTDKGPIARLLKHRFVQYLGRVSYSIYMVQFTVIVGVTIIVKRLFKVPVSVDVHSHRLFMNLNPWTGDALLGCVIVLILLVSTLTYKFVENPMRLLGRRLSA